MRTSNNNFFSMRRFCQVCSKEINENWKQNLLRASAVYGLLMVAVLLASLMTFQDDAMVIYTEKLEQMESVIFSFGLSFGGALAASLMMEPLKSKTGRLSMLMLPATPFEQFICRWLFYTLGFVLLYVVLFCLADWTRVLVYLIAAPDATGLQHVSLSALATVGTNNPLYLSVANYAFFQSFFVLGSVVWPKHSFLKTFVSLIGILVVYSIVVGQVMPSFDHTQLKSLDWDKFFTVSTVVLSVLALFNWTLAYFRFKEWEIISRW